MSKFQGDHVAVVVTPAEEFLPAKDVLKAAKRAKPRRVVVICIDDNHQLTLRSSNLKISDTMMDLIQAQHQLMDIVKEHSEGTGE